MAVQWWIRWVFAGWRCRTTPTHCQNRVLPTNRYEDFSILNEQVSMPWRSLSRKCWGRISVIISHGSEDNVFQEVAKFMLEVAFVSPRFYYMPKQRAWFIISTYEGEFFYWVTWLGRHSGATHRDTKRQTYEANIWKMVYSTMPNTEFGGSQ